MADSGMRRPTRFWRWTITQRDEQATMRYAAVEQAHASMAAGADIIGCGG